MGTFLKEEKVKEICDLYTQGYSVQKIKDIAKVGKSSILKYLELNGINRRTTKETSRREFINNDYFKTVDTPDKAYFLGFMYADGNVCIKGNRKIIQMTLANEDSYMLQKFKDLLGSTNNLCLDRKIYSKMIIYSDKLVDDLIKLGCVPAKSLILKFPTEKQVPSHLLSHFIRGYFDGDGGVFKIRNYLSITFTSTKEFLDELSLLMEKLEIKMGNMYKRYKNHEISAYSTYIKNVDSQKFYEWIYKDCEDLYLTRKKEKFEQKVYK